MTKSQIKARLKRKGMTQSEVARRCNVTASTISLYIMGAFTSQRLDRRVARLLGVTVAELRAPLRRKPAEPTTEVA